MKNNFSVEDALLNVPQAVIAGRGGKVLFTNEAARTLFGCELKGAGLSEVFPEEILQNPSEYFTASAKLRGIDAKVTVRRTEKTTLFYIDSAVRREMPITINRSGLSHLRNCVSGIKMAIDSCSDRIEECFPDGDRGVAALYQYTYRITRAVTQLDMADKLSRGEMIFSPKLVDIAALTSDVVNTLQSLFKSKGIKFEFTCEPDKITTEADPELFEVMLLNLISNSLAGNNKLVEMSLSQSPGGIILSIRDRGKGIPERKMPGVFELPGETGALRPEEGMGLGIFIANEIVRLHKGVLLIESKEDEGVNIKISLPIIKRDLIHDVAELQYNYRGISSLLIGLADVLPNDCFGPKFED